MLKPVAGERLEEAESKALEEFKWKAGTESIYRLEHKTFDGIIAN